MIRKITDFRTAGVDGSSIVQAKAQPKVQAKLGEQQDGRLDGQLGEAQARLRNKRAMAELLAESLSRLTGGVRDAMDLEALKRTGKSPGYAKSVMDEVVAKARRAAGSLIEAGYAGVETWARMSW